VLTFHDVFLVVWKATLRTNYNLSTVDLGVKAFTFSVTSNLKTRKQIQSVRHQERSIRKSVFEELNDHLILILDQAPSSLEIGLDHLLDQRIEIDLALPPEKTLCLCRVTQQ